MKTIILTTVLILMVSMYTMGNKIVAKGSSNSSFGEYKIEQLDNHMMINGKELDQYMISYEKTDLKVVVVLDKLKNCKKYYVLTDQIPVQYECNGLYFGIKKLDGELSSNGFATSMEKLNREVYFHQKVIASETTATVDHLKLIASYYPELFKDNTL
ncbi:MAG TPA: hypothetical protein VN249_06340 [Prolixibacteraceae bacterium]|nr:hypothetical protein [Prolixibacteraceae bacterium]